jgi:hypothetical protein
MSDVETFRQDYNVARNKLVYTGVLLLITTVWTYVSCPHTPVVGKGLHYLLPVVMLVATAAVVEACSRPWTAVAADPNQVSGTVGVWQRYIHRDDRLAEFFYVVTWIIVLLYVAVHQ